MSEVLFYHLTEHRLEQALPGLVERSLGRGWRVAVQTSEPARAAALSDLLWTFRADSFVPSGYPGWNDDDDRAAEQPVWLCADEANPNGAAVRFLVEGARADDLSAYERVVFMFDGHDESAVAAARAQWKRRKEEGHALTYWQQKPGGGWQKAG